MTKESGVATAVKLVKSRMTQWMLVLLLLWLVWYLFAPVRLGLVYIGCQDTEMEHVPHWSHITRPDSSIPHKYSITIPSEVDFSQNYLLVSCARPLKYLVFTRASRLLWEFHDLYHGHAVYGDELMPKRRYLYLTSRRYHCGNPG